MSRNAPFYDTRIYTVSMKMHDVALAITRFSINESHCFCCHPPICKFGGFNLLHSRTHHTSYAAHSDVGLNLIF